MANPTRTVHCGDALQFLRTHPLGAGHALLTSLPDHGELRRLSLQEWQHWFSAAAQLVVESTPAQSAAVFFQTDVKRDGHWIDKAFLVQRGAYAAGGQLLWHKIVCRAPAGRTTAGRPGYAHLLCFAKELRDEPANATADVLPELGEMLWPKAMGLGAAHAAVQWLKRHANAHTIVAPFCGRGTALAVANHHGLHALGIELAPSRAERARQLQL